MAPSRRKGPHPIGTPSGLSTNTGPMASASWLAMLDLVPHEPRWSVEIALAPEGLVPRHDLDETQTSFQLGIYAEEWGFLFCHSSRLSWIRITDVPFVHGRDEHDLIGVDPKLPKMGELLKLLETRHSLRFDRAHVAVRTSVPDGERTVRAWIAKL